MSTDTRQRLKAVDLEVLQLEGQLGFFTRFRRRYANSYSVKAFILGRIEGFLAAAAIVGKGFWVTKFPLVAAVAAAAWDHVVSFVEALILVFASSD